MVGILLWRNVSHVIERFDQELEEPRRPRRKMKDFAAGELIEGQRDPGPRELAPTLKVPLHRSIVDPHDAQAPHESGILSHSNVRRTI